MQKYTAILKNILFAAFAIFSLQACSSFSPPQSNLVAQAYETSGIVSVAPYQRTIFNSGNF